MGQRRENVCRFQLNKIVDFYFVKMQDFLPLAVGTNQVLSNVASPCLSSNKGLLSLIYSTLFHPGKSLYWWGDTTCNVQLVATAENSSPVSNLFPYYPTWKVCASILLPSVFTVISTLIRCCRQGSIHCKAL